MPTRYRAQLDHIRFNWTSDAIQAAVRADSDKILELLNFASEYGDLPATQEAKKAFHDAKEGLLREITGTLSYALALHTDGGLQAAGKMRDTLWAILKDPQLILTRNIEPGALSLIAQEYQRADEPAGTHWYDITGDPLGLAPTPDAIHKAVERALDQVKTGATDGCPPKLLPAVLAKRLGEIFLRFNACIGRSSEFISAERQTDKGPFLEFLKPLVMIVNEQLQARGEMPISAARVARIASELRNVPKPPRRREHSKV